MRSNKCKVDIKKTKLSTKIKILAPDAARFPSSLPRANLNTVQYREETKPENQKEIKSKSITSCSWWS
jgi:hypothetical protein